MTMKNRARFAVCVLAALLLCALTGCRLAREDEGTNSYEDRLAGVLVTTEYLDLFDMESYMNDHLGQFAGGCDVVIDGNAEKYQGRLYATLKKKTLNGGETGETFETDDYVFEGVQGIPYFFVRIPAAEGQESYNSAIGDEAVSDGHTSVNVTDDGTFVALEGTIYVSPKGLQREYFINPVYQSADGRVYAVSCSGFAMDEGHPEGAIFSQKLEAKYTFTENGKSRTDSTSVKISLNVMRPPGTVTVLQMDGSSAVVSRQEYAPGTLPKEIVPEKGAEYIVVETCGTGAQGEDQISRELYGRDAGTITTFQCREDGVCVKRWTEIDWME
jgi:hypothetical protein